MVAITQGCSLQTQTGILTSSSGMTSPQNRYGGQRPPMATRILIADDHDGIRAALSQHIHSIDQSWEIHETEDGQAAIEKAVAVRPELVKAGQAIKELFPNTAMLIYAFTPPAYVEAAAREAGFERDRQGR
jgi:hypothetical protein